MSQSRSAWAQRSLRERIRWLTSVRHLLASRIDELTSIISSEVGKTPWEALTGDLMPLLTAIRWHERHAQRLLRDRKLPGDRLLNIGVRARLHREPLGHIAIIATWNYPLQLLGIQLVQALIAGNTVIVKPSEYAPRSQRYLLDLFAASLPTGTLTWVRPEREAGAALLAQSHFDHILFTGSTQVGRAIAAIAAESLTPTTLELSGADSALVLADADAALAARSIWAAVTMNGGQTCMAPRRALIHRSIYPAFLEALAPLAAAATPRSLINPQAATYAFDLARQACESGARSLSATLEPPAASTIRPLAIVDCPPAADLVRGDHFAPVLAVIPVDSIDHMLSIHLTCHQHLATSIFTSDRRAAEELAPRLRAATVTINDAVLPAAHPGLSIAGIDASGWGHSRGELGLLALTRTVTITNTSTRIRPPLGEPDPAMHSRLSAFLRWLFQARRAKAQTPLQITPAASFPTPYVEIKQIKTPSETLTQKNQ